MPKFKTGQKLKWDGHDVYFVQYFDGDTAIVERSDGEGWSRKYTEKVPANYQKKSSDTYWAVCVTELSSNQKEGMNDLLKGFKDLFRSEKEKAFIKAGLIGEKTGTLTKAGRKLFTTWLLEQHGDDFYNEVVADLVKED